MRYKESKSVVKHRQHSALLIRHSFSLLQLLKRCMAAATPFSAA